MTTPTTTPERPRPGAWAPAPTAPFLEPEPPPLIARGLTVMLLGLFVVFAVASVVVRIPETVTGGFVLVPVRGADPVRAAREGTVMTIGAVEGQQVPQGGLLFTLRSQPVGDRAAVLLGLQAQLKGSDLALANARRQREAARLADAEEEARLSSRAAFLARLLPIKGRELQVAREQAERLRSGVERGVVSPGEAAGPEQEAQRLAAEATMAEAEESDTRAALTRLRVDMQAHALQYEETVRQLTAAREELRIRAAALASDSSDWASAGEGAAGGKASGLLAVRAPCAGTVLRLQVTSVGAVVQAGQPLAEVACAPARLIASMSVSEAGLPSLRVGQGVKLRYDAFPYQRYGVRRGVVRWVGPSGVQRDSLTFRALVEVDSGPVRVRGVPTPLGAGMRGTADVVVGHRTLIEFVFQPLRQLRDAVSDVPGR